MFIEPADLRIVKEAESISEEIWKVVVEWKWFEKSTIGQQLVRSGDSIGANISEGLGRQRGPDSRRFYLISRGSLEETRYWLRKARTRKLFNEDLSESLLERLSLLLKSLNAFIGSHPT